MANTTRRGTPSAGPCEKRSVALCALLVLLALCTSMPMPARADEADAAEQDVLAPSVSVDLAPLASVDEAGSRAYVGADARVEVSISDRHLDKATTTVNGTPLAELLSGGDDAPDPMDERVRYEAWEVLTGVDGTVTYRSTMSLDDGTYTIPLVRAQDLRQNHAEDEHLLDGRRLSALVVDTEPPVVRAAIDRAPACELAEDGGLAFMDARTNLVLKFEDDASGIAQVEGRGLGSLRLETNANKSGARIELAQGTLSNKAKVIVTDHANNKRVWSLAEEGQVVAGGQRRTVINEPLRTLYNDALVCGTGHPAALVADSQPPTLRFGKEPAEGAVLREGPSLTLRVRDANLGRVALLDPCQELVRVTRDGAALAATAVGYDAKASDKTHDYLLRFGADAVTHADDGHYEVTARLRDLSGNESVATRSFVIDTTPPVLRVDVEEATRDERGTTRCLVHDRPVRVSVWDKGLGVEELNAGRLVSVVASARNGRTADEVRISPWQGGAATDEFFCEVSFPRDGEYTLAVYGTDVAGNPLVGDDGTQVDERGRYESGSFVVDVTRPRARLEFADNNPPCRRFGGTDYFRSPVALVATVTDRNLDLARTTVTDSEGDDVVPDWQVSRRSRNGEVTYVATIEYREDPGARQAGAKRPVLRAYDLAGNAAEPVSLDFVVDQTAPYVDAATMSKRAASEGADVQGGDPHRFYNELDGIQTQLSFAVCDEHLVDGVWVDDPEGAYDATMSDARGHDRVDVTLTLKDHDTQGAGRNTDFERNVRLFVRDVAGNKRAWTIDRTGSIEAERQTDASNVSIDGEGVYPMALVKDTTAPTLSLHGIEEGSYHNTTQVERVLVGEYNFDYLLRFRPDRPVVTIRRRAGDSSGEQSTWFVCAREFEGSCPSYAYDCTFAADGHYSLVASVDDMAGNPSGTVSLREFTIDKTAPRIAVTWDNENLRNASGGVGFYDAPRTATVVVEEHNFDPSLFAVRAGAGTVGAWEDHGDAHVCVVRYETDAPAASPHVLEVRGRDLAGNEAEPYVASSFAIDTVAPRVRFLKRVSEGDRKALGERESALEDGTAFAAGIMPIAVLEDDANFDESCVEVRLVGRRDRTKEIEVASMRATGAGARADWGNLGAEEGSGGTSYRMDADDVYTLEAEAHDLAGNTSGLQSVTFSVNRYGSNFFFDEIEGLRQRPDGTWEDALLQEPPRIVVHEISVCGTPRDASGEGSDFHSVTKQYEHVPSAIRRTSTTRRDGYTLAQSTNASAMNPYEGWTEYTYTIQSGNFGAGSSSDYGDGGQGVYRVDVSSQDKASQHNTTSSFFSTPADRTGDASAGGNPLAGKTATVEFTLDEFGPAVKDVDLPGALAVGGPYRASFCLVDAITRGDQVEVLVDGERAEVFREGAAEPVGEGELVQPGTFSFVMTPKPVTCEREVVIRAWDYTGDDSRAQVVRRRGMRLTTLVSETFVALAAGVGVAVAARVVRRARGLVNREGTGPSCG